MNHRIGKVLALALVFACCLCLPLLHGGGAAQAEETGTVRIQGSKSSWRAYRLVAGEVADGRMRECSTEGLMNGEFWKSAGIEAGGQAAAEKLAAIAAGDSGGAATARLGRIALSSRAASVDIDEAEARGGFRLACGCWLLVSDLSQPMLVTVGPTGVSATAKSSGATVKKQVRDSSGRWREAGEASQDEKVPYRVIATMPSNAAAYETLPCKVVDELPAGMWADVESVRVSIRDASGNERDATTACAIACSGGRLTVDVGKGNALSVLPSDPGRARVIVRYEAKLTGKSAVGAAKGNPNLVHLEYPGSPTSTSTVSTEKAKAQVFTWKVRLVKTGSGRPLAGASFELRRADGKVVGSCSTDSEGLADFPSVASGTYQLVETEAPGGYERAADTTVTLRADLGIRGEKTRIAAHAEGAGALRSVSVPKGVVTVEVVDAPKAGSPSGEASGGEAGGSPRTGDALAGPVAAACALGIAAAVLAACAIARRRGAKEETTTELKGR